MADNSQQPQNNESSSLPVVQGTVISPLLQSNTVVPVTDVISDIQETVTSNVPDIQETVTSNVPDIQETVTSNVPVIQGTVVNNPNAIKDNESFSLWNSIKKLIKKISTTDITVMAIYFYLSIIVGLYILIGFILTNCVFDNAKRVFNLITGITNNIIFPTTTTPVPSKKQCVMPTRAIPRQISRFPNSGPTITFKPKPKTTPKKPKKTKKPKRPKWRFF
jgi:hypothetical protein